jgi:hypothetical protein
MIGRALVRHRHGHLLVDEVTHETQTPLNEIRRGWRGLLGKVAS